jgi:hypothetical protein
MICRPPVKPSAPFGTSPPLGVGATTWRGSYNQTGIVQRGANNRAGIRLIGDDNTMNLVQAGDANQFLMDATVSEERMSVVQNGDGNVLDTTLPVNAKMNGNGIELVIRRGSGAPLSLGSGE